MSVRVIGVGGVPASGKTHLMRAVMAALGEQPQPFQYKKLLKGHVFPQHKFLVLGVYAPDEPFAGTDRLSMSVMPVALEFLAVAEADKRLDGYIILFEGDRLFSESFLAEAEAKTGGARWVWLEAPPSDVGLRRAGRPAEQDATWLKGRETKLHNLALKFSMQREIHATPADTARIVDSLVRGGVWATAPSPLPVQPPARLQFPTEGKGGLQLQSGWYASPRWSWEILDCAMPMTLDTYDNCSFQCVYCFSYFQRAVGSGKEDYLHHKVRTINVERVKQLFRGEIPKSQFNAYINQRFVLQWGGLSDGFDYYERKFRQSLDLLRFFTEIDYPLSISSKGVWSIDDPEYVEAYKAAAGHIHWKESIITADEQKAHRIERGVATTRQRFDFLYKLGKLGIPTTFRFRPFILGVSADFPFTNRSAEQIEEIFKMAEDAGCYSATTEFLCLESRASNTAKQRYDILAEVSGIPQFELYRTRSQARAGLLRLNYDDKRPYIDAMLESAHRHNMVMVISDAHHKGRGDNAGCCGLPATGPLSKWNRGQFAEAAQIAKRNGVVHWRDIEPMTRWMHDIPFYRSEGFNHGGTHERVKRIYQNMAEYMHDCWNSTKSMMSPARYFGGELLPATELDSDGDVVYIYNTPYVKDGTRVASAMELQQQVQAQGVELQLDGAAWAHVAFPVVVDAGAYPPEAATTLALLEKARLNYQVYAMPTHFNEYAARFPHADILVYPPAISEASASPMERQEYIREELTQAKYERYWQLSPTIPQFVGEEGLDTVSARAFLSAREAEYPLEALPQRRPISDAALWQVVETGFKDEGRLF